MIIIQLYLFRWKEAFMAGIAPPGMVIYFEQIFHLISVPQSFEH